MTSTDSSISFENNGLSIRAKLIPWDSKVFNCSVAQIEKIKLIDNNVARGVLQKFNLWLEMNDVKIVSCRLGSDQLVESMFLEDQKFHFVEMVLHPTISNLDRLNLPDDDLIIDFATARDIPQIQDIAERCFRYERFHIDPRLDSQMGDLRYKEWVANSVNYPNQELLKIQDENNLIGFFLVEITEDKHAYWHLTAIAPKFQGQGYGARTWKAMLRHHQKQAIYTVNTTISARNVPVLNLYAKLGFRFLPPEMTFHKIIE